MKQLENESEYIIFKNTLKKQNKRSKERHKTQGRYGNATI